MQREPEVPQPHLRQITGCDRLNMVAGGAIAMGRVETELGRPWQKPTLEVVG